MFDVISVLTVIALVLVAMVYVQGCDRLRGKRS